jgi:hypothetical protein
MRLPNKLSMHTGSCLRRAVEGVEGFQVCSSLFKSVCTVTATCKSGAVAAQIASDPRVQHGPIARGLGVCVVPAAACDLACRLADIPLTMSHETFSSCQSSAFRQRPDRRYCYLLAET